ncbi:MAG: TAXI family TRAP transporter solute-binding subunit [Rhodospirillales bacterium]
MNFYPDSSADRWHRMICAGCLLILISMIAACGFVVPGADVMIATDSPSRTSYKLGGSICRLFNLGLPVDGRRCVVMPSSGPVANVAALRDGRIDVGIVHSDVVVDAVVGTGPFTAMGPDTELRILFAGHAEAFTIVARRELGIHSAAALRGKRINMGSPGSGERVSMERIMAALGATRNDFAEVHELTLAEQYRALCANELDAIVYEVPHPNGLIQDVVRRCHGVLVDLGGKEIDNLLRRHPEYERTVIPGGTYHSNAHDVPTLGVRVEVVTTTRLSDDMAYKITRAVFENFEDFRRLHPAFSMLSAKDMANSRSLAPMHAGAIRYYRGRALLPQK